MTTAREFINLRCMFDDTVHICRSELERIVERAMLIAAEETKEMCAKLVENFPSTPKERAFREEAAALIRGKA